jgi:hypothetical protein
MPRTFKEICAVVTDTNKKEIGRCYKAIIKELETNVGVTHVSDFMRRWGSLLGLTNKDMRAGTAIAEAACPRDGMWVPFRAGRLFFLKEKCYARARPRFDLLGRANGVWVCLSV